MKNFSKISVLPLVFLLSSCSILPSIPYKTAENKSFDDNVKSPSLKWKYSGIDKTYRSSPQSPNPGDVSRFVGIAASGGGSRAAIFTAAVLQELDELGFLQHVNAFTSVSGGGLPAAYFALNSPTMIGKSSEWEKLQQLLATDFRSQWVLRTLNPVNVLLTSVTDLDRSDLMADVLDETLYKGATYDKLIGNISSGRPTWIASATDISADGSRFLFEHTSFQKTLNSDLSKLRIARAVQASAAFPGAFNSVTLQRFDNKGNSNGTFRHLIDGGASDNLGLDTLLDLADSHAQAYPDKHVLDDTPIQPFACMLFVIDAFPPGDTNELRSSRDARLNPISHIIDLNFIDTFDSLLSHRRREQLDSLGFAVTQPIAPHETTRVSATTYTYQRSSRDVLLAKGPPASYEYGYPRLTSVLVNPNGRGRIDQSSLRPRLEVKGAEVRLEKSQQSCVVWHIAMSGIRSLMKPPPTAEKPEAPHQRWGFDEPQQQFRRDLWQTISRIKTDFNLVGPKGCKKELLQQSLRDAARIAVREDSEALNAACEWFGKAFNDVKDTQFVCKPIPIEKYLVRSNPLHINEDGSASCPPQ